VLQQVKSAALPAVFFAWALSFADRHHFDFNLSGVPDNSTQCKRNWQLNVIAARQRFERQQANLEGIQTLSIAHSKLIKWMTAAGQAAQCTPSVGSAAGTASIPQGAGVRLWVA